MLTPTPKIALEVVETEICGPATRNHSSDYSINERYRHMSDAADEIAEIASEIAAKSAWSQPPRDLGPRRQLKEGKGRIEFDDRTSLDEWLSEQSAQVAIVVGARAAMRILPQ